MLFYLLHDADGHRINDLIPFMSNHTTVLPGTFQANPSTPHEVMTKYRTAHLAVRDNVDTCFFLNGNGLL